SASSTSARRGSPPMCNAGGSSICARGWNRFRPCASSPVRWLRRRRQVHDVVVKGGRIVDGTGAPARAGDVAIAGGHLVEVGAVSGRAARTIDAEGHVVAPGFIDAHTHYDAQLLWDPSANPSTIHGITTILMGNCGYTLAPVRERDQDYVMGLFS